jgi:excinuclease UvrABC helicase subunit UvrB
LSGILDAAEAGGGAVGETPGAATLERRIAEARRAMLQAAAALDFEQAIRLRDELRRLEALQLEFAGA